MVGKGKLVAFIAIAFVVGLAVGISTSQTFSDTQTISAFWVAVSGVIGLLIGQVVGVFELIRDILKGRHDKKLQAKFKLEYKVMKEDHPFHKIGDFRVITIKVTNSGGLQPATNCEARIIIDGVFADGHALHWVNRTKPQPATYDSPLLIRREYLKNEAYTVPAINQGASELVEVLFTKKGHNKAYIFDAPETEIEFGKSYVATLTITSSNVNSMTRKYRIDIPAWEPINVSDITS